MDPPKWSFIPISMYQHDDDTLSHTINPIDSENTVPRKFNLPNCFLSDTAMKVPHNYP